jgi:hypothetical protein
MNATARQVTGALNIAGAIRAELIHRGRREEEISLEWLPDPAYVPPHDSPELRAALQECGSVQQMFSREELEVSSEQLDRQSVVAKINLIVESLQAGLP